RGPDSRAPLEVHEDALLVARHDVGAAVVSHHLAGERRPRTGPLHPLPASGGLVTMLVSSMNENARPIPRRWALLAFALATPVPAQKTPVRVDPGGYNPQIAVSGSSVYAVWDDRHTTSLNHEIYFNRSLDGGITWLPISVRLNVGTAAGATQAGAA